MIFIQDYGTYFNEMLVLVGKIDKKKLLRFLKKEKVKFEVAKWILENFDDWNDDEAKGKFCFNKKLPVTVMVLRKVEDTWIYWEILMHECHHAVHFIAETKCMYDEPEAQAYLFDYLFRSLRRKLDGTDKI